MVIKDEMDKTFSLRRQEIVGKETGVEEWKRWPALFTMDEVSIFFFLNQWQLVSGGM